MSLLTLLIQMSSAMVRRVSVVVRMVFMVLVFLSGLWPCASL